jgi:hypothetical protein
LPAQKYVVLNRLQIAAVGDASKTRAILAKFGTVEEYDAEGKSVRAVAKWSGKITVDNSRLDNDNRRL